MLKLVDVVAPHLIHDQQHQEPRTAAIGAGAQRLNTRMRDDGGGPEEEPGDNQPSQKSTLTPKFAHAW